MTRRATVVALAAVLALAPHRTARASSCKGALDVILELAGDAVEAAGEVSSKGTPEEPCSETSDVHGHRRCTKFGSWGRPRGETPWFLEIGGAMRRFVSPLGERTGSLSHDGQQFSYRVVGPAARSRPVLSSVAVVEARGGVRLPYGLFVAGEGELGTLGDGSVSPEVVSSVGRAMPDVRNAGVTMISGLGIVGWRAQADNLSLGLEAAAGFRAVTYHFDSSLRSCDTTSSLTTFEPVVEGRARVAYRVAADIALGATAGRSALDDAWLAGLFVSLHDFE